MWLCLLFAILPSMRVCDEYWLHTQDISTALTEDVEVLYGIPSSGVDLRLQLVRLTGNGDKTVAKRDLPSKISTGRIIFPCGIFGRAGKFIFKLLNTKQDQIMAQTKAIDVRWPEVTVHVPLIVETYSSNVIVQLYSQSLKCKYRGSYAVFADLIYEGSSAPTWYKPSVLMTKDLTRWKWDASFDILLDCEFFDRAGNYTVQVRTNLADAPVISTSDTIMVMWSHRYSVSVAKTSVQPCDESLSVIYHYPRCILDQDRIRVYGKARRGHLKYIQESRIESGKHSTKLSCDIFHDEFQEYCFRFVSTARNGAVFDIKTHCIPTLLDKKRIESAWSNWGPWSGCSVTCGNGIQSRYRLCVSSPNNTDCTGKAVQSQSCKIMECEVDFSSTTPVVPLLWDCSCGCGRNVTSRDLLTVSILSCEVGSSWLIYAWPTGHVIIEISTINFPASDYWLVIRDGESKLGLVLALWSHQNTNYHPVHSLTEVIRLEVYTSNSSKIGNVDLTFSVARSETPRESLAMIRQKVDNSLLSSNLSAVHVTIIMLAAVICSTILFLVIFHIYRKSKLKKPDLLSSTLGVTDDLQTSTSDLSIKTPSTCPEDYLYNSFIFRSTTSLRPKLKWDKLPPKIASPIRRRGKPILKNTQRESTTPLTVSVSELSTNGSDDGLEYDYYDYGCHEEPGSFFCPDPVLIGWPPFIPLPPQGVEELGDYPLQHFTPSPDPS